MKREDAIALLDNHWTYNHEDTIYEQMGPKSVNNLSWEASTLEDMLSKAYYWKHEKLIEEIAQLETSLSREPFLQWLAKHNIGRRKSCENIRKYFQSFKDRLDAKQNALNKLINGKYFEVKRLPEEMRVPHLLSVGTPLWHVAYYWPLDTPIKIAKYVLTKITIYSYGDKDWDVNPTYTFESKDSDKKYGFDAISLQYPFADPNHAIERYQYRDFLNFEDAKRYAEGMLLALENKLQIDKQIISNTLEN